MSGDEELTYPFAAVRAAMDAMIESLDLPKRALCAKGVSNALRALGARQDERWAIVLGGPVGAGKTVAAVQWLVGKVTDEGNWSVDGERPMWSGVPPVWLSAFQVPRLDRYSEDVMRKITRASHLVIDDLGAEYADVHGSLLTTLGEVIDERYQRSLPTLMTTSIGPRSFRERYGERIMRRIDDGGEFVVVPGYATTDY